MYGSGIVSGVVRVSSFFFWINFRVDLFIGLRVFMLWVVGLF